MKQEVLQDIACLAQMRSGGQDWRDDCLQAIELIKKGTFDADLEEFGQDDADLETVSDYILKEVKGSFAPLRKASKVLEP
jgi:hypothetical protein